MSLTAHDVISGHEDKDKIAPTSTISKDGSGPPAPRFIFVSGRSAPKATYRGSVRAHVLRRHIDLQKSRRTVKHYEKRPSVKGEDDSSNYDHNASDDDEELKKFYILAANFLSERRALKASPLASSVGDPFDSHARKTTSLECILQHQFVYNRYPWAMKPLTGQFQPSRDIFFHYCTHDPLTMDVMAWYGAKGLTRGNADQQLQRVELEWKDRTLKHLMQRIKADAKNPSPHLLIAVAGITCMMHDTRVLGLDDASNSLQLQLHAQGLRALIGGRRGWETIKMSSFKASWIVLWVDTQTQGAVLADLTQPFRSFAQSGGSEYLGSASNNWMPEAKDLVLFYRECYEAAQRRLISANAQATTGPVLDPIHLFQPGTSVYRILRHPTRSNISPLCPLVYVNLLLWKIQDWHPSKKAALYNTLRENFIRLQVETEPCCETVFWALVTNTQKVDFLDLSVYECTLSLRCTVTAFGSRLEERLVETLCDFLVLYSGDMIIGADNWWGPQQFAEEVFSGSASVF